ncbi:thiamine phosphate synthase [Sphingomonas sp. DT-51]
MRPRHPDRWLMTDERQGDALWPALERLPRGAGVVFRHHATPSRERARMFARVAAVARRRGLMLVRAGATRFRGEQGVHGRRGRGLMTSPAHSRREAVAAVRAGAAIVFVSPVFATRSHLGARGLGACRAALIARGLPVRAIALGGIDESRYRRRLRALGFAGFAAIDAWTFPDDG